MQANGFESRRESQFSGFSDFGGGIMKSIACKHCGDLFFEYRCSICGGKRIDTCPECHGELVHGSIPNVPTK